MSALIVRCQYYYSLLHPLLQAPDRVVVIGVLKPPEGPGLVAGRGPSVGHGGLHSLGPASSAADAVIDLR